MTLAMPGAISVAHSIHSHRSLSQQSATESGYFSKMCLQSRLLQKYCSCSAVMPNHDEPSKTSFGKC